MQNQKKKKYYQQKQRIFFMLFMTENVLYVSLQIIYEEKMETFMSNVSYKLYFVNPIHWNWLWIFNLYYFNVLFSNFGVNFKLSCFMINNRYY